MEVIFESKRIKFVKVTKELINDYLTMINDPDVSVMIKGSVVAINTEEENSWIEKKLAENAICYSMIEKSTNEFIGNIEIMHIENGIGEIGVSLTPRKQDMHYGTEAIGAIIEYGYNVLKLDGFYLNVYKTNPRAIHCYENLGFVESGPGGKENAIQMTYKKR